MLEICKVCNTKPRLIESGSWGDMIWCDHCDKELCPDCGAHIRAKTLGEGGGVECTDKCGYWFCF